MNIYFADRLGQVIYSVSSSLPGGNEITADTESDDVTTGFKSFEASFLCNEKLRSAAAAGNFVMKGGKEYELYTITESEYNAGEKTLTIYAEDAGLDLIGKTCGAWKPDTAQTIVQAVTNTLGSGYQGWQVNYEISTAKTVSGLEYSSDETAVARLLSIADAFDAEIFFSYDIDGFSFINRYINIVPARGQKDTVHTFRLGSDLSSITEKASTQDLATVFVISGADGKKLSKLSGYSTYSGNTYGPDDPAFSTKRTHSYRISADEVQCIEGMASWATPLSPSGRVVKIKETGYKSAKNAISYAIREMEKVVDVAYTYEISFAKIPEGVQAGDMIRIIDEEDELYLESRILSWRKSETAGTFECEIGDYVRLAGSKAEIDYSKFSVCTLSITSDNGTIFKNGTGSTVLTASVFYNAEVITTPVRLREVLGNDAHIVWKKDGNVLSEDVFSVTVTAASITDKSTYTCSIERT